MGWVAVDGKPERPHRAGLPMGGGRVLQVLFLLMFAVVSFAPACARAEKAKPAEKPKAIEPLISKDTRLMVFSPHPDDESLGAAGLIQRVLETGGSVKVVFMTNGDGFPEAVEMGGHISNPTAKDFRQYGEDRMYESLKALAMLGMKESDVIFLRFPDGGLTALRSKPAGSRSPTHPLPPGKTSLLRSQLLCLRQVIPVRACKWRSSACYPIFGPTCWRRAGLRIRTRTMPRLTFSLSRHGNISIRSIRNSNPRGLST